MYKTQPDIELSGLKIFNNGFAVNKYIETEKINGIYLGNILRNSGEQSISSPLNIKGNVEVTCNATVSGNLNGVSLNYIADSFELSEDGYKINGMLFLVVVVLLFRCIF